MAADHRDWIQLRDLLRRYSVRYGDFVLASGQRSTVYVDAKLTTCRAVAMPLVGRLFLAKIRERGWRPAAIGGLTMGADPIVLAVAHESAQTGTPVDCFLVRKEPKKHGRQKFLEGLEGDEALDVVVVDDVCTTGDSTVKAIERSREAGFRVLGAICLVDREMGARDAMAKLECPFDRIFTLRDVTEEAQPGAVRAADRPAGASR